FGMTGDLAYYRDVPPRFARVILDFRNGAHLAFEDMRLFGFAELLSDPDEYIRDHELGPDPLDPRFGLRDFRRLLEKRRGAIKAVLLSQNVIAGVGNLYADETLFRSGVDPRRPADRLSAAEIKAVFADMRKVLRDTIDLKVRGGTYPARFLLPHREKGERCPRCHGTIQRTVVGGRTTYYCAAHQR
ncbi:MAG: formamidopyrimidine-DNA glycosylase, partial [Thermoanaerobaculia bacterium]|nr:formamidopyrimidine-DNA glycosylase [Thermoanaerobaculia bacterium]